MPRLVTGDQLRNAVANSTFIQDGDPAGVEAVKYDFHMGDRVLKALYGQPKDIGTIPEEERWVDPGEAVFLLTREKLDLPANMIAVLTPKRKLAHAGIMMLGGLAVDPCYRGHLLLGLYNFSSTKFPLRPDAKLIAAVFYELDGPEACDMGVPPDEVTDFPDDLVRLISNYKPVELKGLQDALSDTQRQLENLRNDVTTDKTWREDFKRDLDEHNKQLGLLIEGLRDEKESRKSEDAEIKKEISGLSRKMFGGTLAVWALALLATAAVTAVITILITRVMDGPKPAVPTNRPAAATAPPSPQGTAPKTTP